METNGEFQGNFLSFETTECVKFFPWFLLDTEQIIPKAEFKFIIKGKARCIFEKCKTVVVKERDFTIYY